MFWITQKCFKMAFVVLVKDAGQEAPEKTLEGSQDYSKNS